MAELRSLTLDDVKEIIKDPFRTIIVDPLQPEIFIATLGHEPYEIIEQVDLAVNVNDALCDWEESDVVYYSNYEMPPPMTLERQHRIIMTYGVPRMVPNQNQALKKPKH